MASCRWVLDAAGCVSPDSDQKLSKKKNTVAVKDGRLRAAARSEGLTSLSERSKKNAKSRLARAAARAEKRFPVVFLLEGVL